MLSKVKILKILLAMNDMPLHISVERLNLSLVQLRSGHVSLLRVLCSNIFVDAFNRLTKLFLTTVNDSIGKHKTCTTSHIVGVR